MVVTRDDAPSIHPEAETQQGQQQGATASQQGEASQPPYFFLSGAEINRVGMRIPEFTPDDPELWFRIIDRGFQTAGITTDATKFGYAVTVIPSRYTQEVRDIIMNPPAQPYETLKTELIKRLSASQEQKTRKLLEHEEIGDRKPSQFLRHLRSLAGSAIGENILRTIWLSRLPAHLQPHLVTRTDEALDRVADVADAIAEAVRGPAFQVAETARSLVPAGRSADPEPSIVAALEAKVNLQMAQMRLSLQQELTEQFATLKKSIEAIGEQRPHRSGGDDRRRGRPRSRGRGHQSNGMCWYHWRFGPDATRCDPPCSQAAGNALGPR